MMNKILIDSKLFYDALIKLDNALRLSQKYLLEVETAWSLMLKAKAYINIGNIN